MSVYLQRSPYLTSYRAGGARKIRKRKNRRLWDAGSSMMSRRPRRRPNRSILGNLSKQTSLTARKTGAAVKRSATTFSEVAHAVTNVRSKKIRFEFGSGAAITSLTVVAVLLGLGYLAHFNQVATKGYELRRLEADRQQLLSQYEIKNMKLAEIQSLNSIVQTEKANGMRRPYEVQYVRGASVLASK